MNCRARGNNQGEDHAEAYDLGCGDGFDPRRGGVVAQSERVQAGTLTCDISGGIGFIIGSQKALNCSFVAVASRAARVLFRHASASSASISAAPRGGVMMWLVYAPTARAAGSLAGTYVGASAEATLGAGVGANCLIGGSSRTVDVAAASRCRNRRESTSRPASPRSSCASCADPFRAADPANGRARLRFRREPSGGTLSRRALAARLFRHCARPAGARRANCDTARNC